jgi:hypothetical protein
MEVRLHPLEAVRLVPPQGANVIPGPHLETADTALRSSSLCLSQQLSPDTSTLKIRVHGEMPDHPSEYGWSDLTANGTNGARSLFILHVDHPHDRAIHIRHQLNGGAVVTRLVAEDGIVIGRFQKGEGATAQPSSLVGVPVRAEGELEVWVLKIVSVLDH